MVEATSDTTETSRTGASRWAMFALGTSVAFCCPLATIIGPLLAVRALVEIRANPRMSGRGMAIAALCIGALGCVGWIAFMFWWNANVRDPMLHGPQAAIRAGQAGDLLAFREEFIDVGATGSDARINEFLAAMHDRYGVFQFALQDQMAGTPPPASGRDFTIPYMLTFDTGQVRSEVRWSLFARGLEPRILSITVKDAQRGELTYP